MDQVLQETRKIRPMTNQIAYNTFITDGLDHCALPTGPKVICFGSLRLFYHEKYSSFV